MEYSGITQNKYIIGCDPCHEDGDHFVICIKSPSDEVMELSKPMDMEHIHQTIYTAFGVPKKYWGK